MRIFAAFIVFAFMAASHAMAGERSDCHTYDAKDTNPNVQREFGELFRKGYEVGMICGAVQGAVSYYVGRRPAKGPTGICRYELKNAVRELVLDQRLTEYYSHKEGSYAWQGIGNCPPPGDTRYYAADGISDDAFRAMMDFWHRVQKKDDLGKVFAGLPNNAVKGEFLDSLRSVADSKKMKVEDLRGAWKTSSSSTNAVGKEEPHYSMVLAYYGYPNPISSPSFGWSIIGKIKASEFEPVGVGMVQY